MDSNDYEKYYNIEKYLFSTVTKKFSESNELNTFDFFCIVIWKANRAKSKIAKRILAHHDGKNDKENLDAAVRALICGITSADDPKERLRLLIADWGFRLPMATAILTVLYPEDFTVYDVRVCDALGEYGNVQYKTSYEAIWTDYSSYLQSVHNSSTNGSLRDKDRFLWGKSFANQLSRQVSEAFNNVASEDEFEA